MPDTVRASRAPRLVLGLFALLLYALLIDAAVETYRSNSPVGVWVAIPVALYVSFTLWLLRQGPRRGPGAKTSVWVSSFLFLALLAVTAMQPAGLSHGMRVAGYPTSTVMSVTTIGIILLALTSLIVGSPLPIAARVVLALAGGYGIAAFGARPGRAPVRTCSCCRGTASGSAFPTFCKARSWARSSSCRWRL